MDKNNIIAVYDYSEKSVLTRLFLSQSWAVGFSAGFLTCGFSNSSSYRPSRIITNGALPFLKLPLAIASWSGVTGAALVLAPVRTLSYVSLLADAFGIGTGKSFGALRAGFSEGRYGHVTANFEGPIEQDNDPARDDFKLEA